MSTVSIESQNELNVEAALLFAWGLVGSSSEGLGPPSPAVGIFTVISMCFVIS